MNKLVLSSIIAASFVLTACEDMTETAVEKENLAPAPVVQEQTAPAKQESAVTEKQAETTTVTEENYDLAETQGIFESYVKKIADATGTNGVGVFWHVKTGADPKDKTIPRINFDTIYSWSIIDFTEDLTLTMPETNGRYQSAWFIDEEHYNPMALNDAGEYTITKEDIGTRYAMIGIRTQANTADPADLAEAGKLQEKLKLSQKDRGSYVPSYKWNHEEVLKMRAHFEQVIKDKNITSEVMFGKRGTMTDEQHNAGTAGGWGGFEKEQAVYPLYYPTSTEHQTLTLKDVPAGAFWSVTVYDDGGFAQTDTYNINSQFAVKNEDGSVTINFGGDKNADNYMETFEGWTITLRIYRPQEAYFNGEWKKPELKIVPKN